jgi:glycosyltransferase involved in cell wall biosynthesis
MASIGIVSYRLGGADGVSVEAAKWAGALGALGHSIRFIAGRGGEGVELVQGLELEGRARVDQAALHEAFEGLDVVFVENLCSLPLNPAATSAVAAALKGRPAVLRHHDLPWQRVQTAPLGLPPDDPCWRHVTINRRSHQELAAHGIASTCLYNRFLLDPPQGAREATRRALGIEPEQRLVVQPTRALPRKNIPGGLHLAEALGASYWLTAAAEDDFQGSLEELLGASSAPVIRGLGSASIHDAYAAADLVVLPSTWEGFGNPSIESVTHRRPLALGRYAVAAEIRAFGFEFFDPSEVATIGAALSRPDPELVERNLEVARAHFDLNDLPGELEALLASFEGPRST